MADPLIVAPNDVGVHEVPLTAGVEVTVRFAFSVREIEVENVTGTGRVYFTTDGTPATVKGPNCRAVPATLHALEVTRDTYTSGTPTTVRLIAATDTVVSVTRLS